MGDVHCLQCGYNLRGHAESGICPECGFAFDARSLIRLRRRQIDNAAQACNWLIVSCFALLMVPQAIGVTAAVSIAFAICGFGAIRLRLAVGRRRWLTYAMLFSLAMLLVAMLVHALPLPIERESEMAAYAVPSLVACCAFVILRDCAETLSLCEHGSLAAAAGGFSWLVAAVGCLVTYLVWEELATAPAKHLWTPLYWVFEIAGFGSVLGWLSTLVVVRIVCGRWLSDNAPPEVTDKVE